MKSVWLSFIYLVMVVSLQAQTWKDATYYGSNQGTGINSLKISITDQLYTVGITADTMVLGNDTLRPPAPGRSFGYIAKFEPDGTPIWGRAVYTNKGTSAQNFHFPYNLAVTPDNRAVLTTHFSNTMIMGQDTLYEANGGTFMACYDSLGNLLWVRNFGQPNVPGANAMELSPPVADVFGNVYVACAFTNKAYFQTDTLSASQGGIYILKLNNQGEEQWVRQYGGPGYAWTRTYDLAIDFNNFLYLTGAITSSGVFGPDTLVVLPTRSVSYVAKIDPAGNCLWGRQGGAVTKNNNPGQLGSVTYGNAVAAGEADRIYYTGYFHDTVQFGNQTLVPLCGDDYCANFFLAAYDKAGNFLWVRQSPAGTPYAAGTDLLTDLSGNVYVAGTYRTYLAFNGPSITAPFTNPLAFLAKFDKNGQCNWIIDTYQNYATISLDARCPYSDIVVGKSWTGTSGAFVPFGLPYNTLSKSMIARLDAGYSCVIETTAVPHTEALSGFTIQPNPATTQCMATVPARFEEGHLMLFDLLGRLVRTVEVAGSSTTISLEGLASGCYVVRVQDKNGLQIRSARLIKE